MTDQNTRLLRYVCGLAMDARNEGNHPFAAILVDGSGGVIMESKNQGHGGESGHVDRTAHAELLLARAAAATYPPEELAGYSVYTNCEPCCMCAGAMYWAGVGRLVFGITEHHLLTITGAHEENPTLDLPSRDVFARGQRRIEVIGPVDLPEALSVHEGFWT